MEDIKQGISNAWEGLKSWFKGIWDSLFGGLQVDVGVAGSSSGTNYGPRAVGIDYVPNEGYARVHPGEAILTAEENREYRSGNRYSGDTYNFYSPKALNPTTAAREMRKSKQQLALGIN